MKGFGEENQGRAYIYIYIRQEEEGQPKRRWVQDITDDLQMSASDAGHLAYDKVLPRKAVKGAMFRQLLNEMLIEDPFYKRTQATFLTQCCLTVILVLLDVLNLLYKFVSEKWPMSS
jgi:hypothetical protein